MKIHMNNETIEEHYALFFLVKHKSKEVTQPRNKFGNFDAWNDIDLFDAGENLQQSLEHMNLLNYD